jgi:hypothetical protein
LLCGEQKRQNYAYKNNSSLNVALPIEHVSGLPREWLLPEKQLESSYEPPNEKII